MAQKLTGSIPQNLDLEFNYVIEWAALDPDSGDDVDGVVISQATLLVNDLVQGSGAALAVGPFILVPGQST